MGLVQPKEKSWGHITAALSTYKEVIEKMEPGSPWWFTGGG